MIKNKIDEAKNILITAHINPDGDAIGSGMGLYLGLKNKYRDKKIDFALQDKPPKNVYFLKEVEKIKSLEEIEKTEYDLAIIVDSANLDRIGNIKEKIKDTFKINIDHHISNPKYGDINIVEDISSTSELMFTILKKLDIEISLEMAEFIYLGIVNDTGNFCHSNVTEKTFKVASELMKIGVNNNKIVSNFFKFKSINRLRLLGKALTEMKFDENKKLNYFYMPHSYLEEYGATKDDTEGIVEELLNYDKCQVSLFLREETDGRVKGSLRSKDKIDVNRIAGLFDGGGHIKAAGFSSNLPVDKIIEEIIKNI